MSFPGRGERTRRGAELPPLSAMGTRKAGSRGGRIRRGAGGPYAMRRRLMLASLLGAGLAVTVRAAELQVAESHKWAVRAHDQQSQRLELPAPRGTIYDRDGVPLATSRDAFRVAVAPGEVTDRQEAVARLRNVLGMSRSEARTVLNGRRRWVPLRGEHDAVVKDALDGLGGFYFERVQTRHYPHGDLALALLGRVDGNGAGATGLELQFDALLGGESGMAVVRRDAQGEPIPGAMMMVSEPSSGADVYLTIDHQLQEIAHGALREALASTGAAGGDMIIADPYTGEILAATSMRRDGVVWSGATEPYEPGSTIKPFLVASLLAEGQASLDDTVFAENGRYEHEGRVLTDSHPSGWLSVREALSHSSNIAMAKLVERLEAAEQYRYLRDFGFGTITGVAYPSESSGLLRRPSEWSEYSAASLAIGYEVSVTPLQMTLAYAALANGGVLMEPQLLREVRSREGLVVERREARPIRRVISQAIADSLRPVLVDVVDEGSGQNASLGAFRLAGKTGTARAFRNGAYEPGAYTASFAGFFPADDPQLVFLVKLDRPQGDYYGSLTAAPVTRATLEAALAARGTPLVRPLLRDPHRVIREVDAVSDDGGASALMTALSPAVGAAPSPPGAGAAAGAFVFMIGGGAAPLARVESVARPLPDVRGLPLRDAAALLHRSGFAVRVDGRGPVTTMAPDAGRLLPVGSVVTVRGSAGSTRVPDSGFRIPDSRPQIPAATISLRSAPDTRERNPESRILLILR
ncbi:MAG TPA: penicillin-binding transpeptidase domain-containing protein [Longimicrobiales bacterium]|nr:penicillin-binding transpeptidase domain-containing protein [Longimicrobiales bacterium]